MVFVANKHVGNFIAFDMPLLHIHDEKFNQPIFLCNNISGLVEPVIPDDQHRALYSTHAFKINSVRQYSQQYASREEQRADPLQEHKLQWMK
ncbi:hypothetical protein LOK49_LG09G01620 [Camellia lanceoleosa]|uniref:Uncharacterized protein n=1 Tax=Camellia lanceoleosa TaxID=1840588 RepID=A0ACC0GEY8_9ERIC|nr:hypothetical protein LOK49_LG09G01620 [Camellia lanceoleosa]